MEIHIRQEALDLLFRVLLSCRCPVTSDQEEAIYAKLKKLKSAEKLRYKELLDIFEVNDSSVFHRLVDFVIWGATLNVEQLVIEREHVLRHFASSYHWDHVVGQGMDSAYRKVISIPKWFIGHMLLPVKIEKDQSKTIRAIYEFDGGQIELRNLFFPPEFDIASENIWGVHFATVITKLSDKEESIVRTLIDMNRLFVSSRKEIEEIDYSDFERFGDYTETSKERYRTYFSL